jgi:hypothetical protein
MRVDEAAVRWAYRLILGRDAEGDAIAQRVRNAADRGLSGDDMALRIIASEEIRTTNPRLAPKIGDMDLERLEELQLDGFRFAFMRDDPMFVGLLKGLPSNRVLSVVLQPAAPDPGIVPEPDA